MTDILLLGTFHFNGSPLDIFSPDSQAALQSLARRLADFAPDAVAVEAAAHQQAVLDGAFARFQLADLEDPIKMKNEDLGTIHVFQEDKPMSYRNETVQVGFRLGKLLGLPRVWAVDDDSEMDGEPFEHPSAAVEEAIEQFNGFASQQGGGILEELRHCNDPAWSRLNHAIYIRAAETGGRDRYLGADAIAQWYRRNLRIFSNIQRLAQDHRRIFALYGAGHLHLLRQLIQEDSRLRLADSGAYLS